MPVSSPDRYTFSAKLGEGTYGVVYKGHDRETGQTVALKKIRLELHDDGMPSTSLREISVLKALHHPNIVNLLDVVSSNSRLLLVFEFCQGDLLSIMKKKQSPLSHSTMRSYMHQLLTGLSFCHSHRIIHRDLKPQNLLILGNSLKIADFGLARAFQIPLSAYTHEIVTLWYRAPEVLLGEKRYSTVVDSWSCGAIMAEMANKTPLFPGDSEIDELFLIFRLLGTPDEKTWPGVTSCPDYQPVFPQWKAKGLASACKTIEPAGIDLMEKLLCYNPTDRINAPAALKHPYFTAFDMS